MQSLEGVHALVSGAASELGSQVVRALAERGAAILAADAGEERVEAAIAELGLEDPDAIFVHDLEGNDVVAWWDLANLVGSYFHTLHVFVHVCPPIPPVPVRAIGAEPLRAAQAASTDSLVNAMARLEKYLLAAAEEDARGARVVAVVPGAIGEADADAPGAACHAATLALADALTLAFSESESNVRVHAVRTAGGDPRSAAVEILGRIEA